MAKKHAWLKWVIFSVVLIPLLWLICALITSIPVYPAFQKQVDSLCELQQCLQRYTGGRFARSLHAGAYRSGLCAEIG